MKRSSGRNGAKSPCVSECHFFPLFPMTMAAPEALPLNFRASGHKVWNQRPKPFYFLHHCIYLHNKSSAVAAFFMKQFWQPKQRRIFHLLLLADIATFEYHENVFPECLPLIFSLPVSFGAWASRAQPSPLCYNVIHMFFSWRGADRCLQEIFIEWWHTAPQ